MIQHGVNKVIAKVEMVNYQINTDYSGKKYEINNLKMNDIGSVYFILNKPIYYDKFSNHRINGSFIIINLITNKTAGVGFLN